MHTLKETILLWLIMKDFETDKWTIIISRGFTPMLPGHHA